MLRHFPPNLRDDGIPTEFYIYSFSLNSTIFGIFWDTLTTEFHILFWESVEASTSLQGIPGLSESQGDVYPGVDWSSWGQGMALARNEVAIFESSFFLNYWIIQWKTADYSVDDCLPIVVSDLWNLSRPNGTKPQTGMMDVSKKRAFRLRFEGWTQKR